jgi:hypothetical protein
VTVILVEIFAIAAASVTTMVLASLRFAAVLDAREREEPTAARPAVKLEPFQLIAEESICPKCGARWRSELDKDAHQWVNRGPRMVGLCSAQKCEAAGQPHLHVSCDTCNGRWLMATKDAPPPPPIAEPPP